MGIMDEDVVRVREETDVVRLITQHTQLKKSGRQWMGLCPFHGEKSPSFSVNQEKGVYYCFGCQVSGDAIDFVREMENLDFAGAVEYLAGRAGITLHYTDRNEGKTHSRRKHLTEAIGKAAAFYHDLLLSDSAARPAREYLKDRGFDGEVARRFSIGWAPDDWSQLANHLQLSDADLKASGLGGINRRGAQYDSFRARIMFPIFDERDNPVGFGGRKLPDAEGPKYKNTSDAAETYSKSRVLYGLNWAKTEAGRTDEIVVCEGYTDVIGFHLAGVERAVATCGTAMTPDHARKLARFAPRVVLAFDADGAGQSAAERVYEWEEEFGLQFAVVDLPADADPGDLFRTDPDGLRRAVDQARPFLEFRVDRVLGRGDLSTVEGRAHAAEEAAGLVAQHPNVLVRDQYLVGIADRCLLDVKQLRQRSRTRKAESDSATSQRRREVSEPESTATRLTPETQALRLLAHRPDEIAGFLAEVLFTEPVSLDVYRALRDAADLPTAMSSLNIDPDGSTAAALLGRLLVEDASDDEHVGVLSRLLALAAERLAVELEALARRDEDLSTYQPAISYLRTQVMQLREPSPDIVELEPLLRWLVDYQKGRSDG
ncbi:MAG TPA: DNA primase [Acidimicrobiaceae bacterium]|jgi:DNA primase|nr:DNA primase [Acidimicrobiaceae bacterium]HCV36179.1 DNA primase [Acidimicrobiaceae bacterium]HJO80677.1 DNA primase [Acidimicrobiales bacterium]|tara:strand:- start:2414 stop:4216 length:1803 start_codon:yes stop_codon:yes gene_type:complete